MAKILTINVQRTYNTGNYQSMKFGGEFEVEDGETLEAATAFANKAVSDMYSQWVKEENAKRAAEMANQAQQPQQPQQQVKMKTYVQYGTPKYEELLQWITENQERTMDDINKFATMDERTKQSVEELLKTLKK